MHGRLFSIFYIFLISECDGLLGEPGAHVPLCLLLAPVSLSPTPASYPSTRASFLLVVMPPTEWRCARNSLFRKQTNAHLFL